MDVLELAAILARPDAIPVVLVVGIMAFFSARSLRAPK